MYKYNIFLWGKKHLLVSPSFLNFLGKSMLLDKRDHVNQANPFQQGKFTINTSYILDRSQN